MQLRRTINRRSESILVRVVVKSLNIRFRRKIIAKSPRRGHRLSVA
jgi:hypothetical protein